MPWLNEWTSADGQCLKARLAQLDPQDNDFLLMSFALWQCQAQLDDYNLEQDFKVPKLTARPCATCRRHYRCCKVPSGSHKR
ncbi:hypothetical protein AC626_25340 [Pseudoalteromonas rubra]|uniref:Uncharacterized protein n=1 Tax=Pseudoalteromonas rubra TaxID=43658 RepID=A0A0L0ELA8_9GAMM|nr:hypothetical protein AC626_25340 [Pseudoalteromonas rubra]